MGYDLGAKRRGRWITEEEDFARACIDAFSAGMLSGVEEGTTLRAFLSKQLDCQPMRVTKKLHGSKGMGKRLFHKAKSATSVSVDAVRLELSFLEARMSAKVLAKSGNMPAALRLGAAARQRQATSTFAPVLLEAPTLTVAKTATLSPAPIRPKTEAAAESVGGGGCSAGASGPLAQKGPKSRVVRTAQQRPRQRSSTGTTPPTSSKPPVAAAAGAGARRSLPRVTYAGAVGEVTTGRHPAGEVGGPTTSGRSTHCRRRIYSTDDPLQPRERCRQRKKQKRQQRPAAAAAAAAAAVLGIGSAGDEGDLRPLPTCSFQSSTDTSRNDNDEDTNADGDVLKLIMSEFGGVERGSTSASAMPESSIDHKDGAPPIGDAGDTGSDPTSYCGAGSFSCFRSDNGFVPLLGRVKGEGDSSSGNDVLGLTPPPRSQPPPLPNDYLAKPPRRQHRTNNNDRSTGPPPPLQITLADSTADIPQRDKHTTGQKQRDPGGSGSRSFGGTDGSRNGRAPTATSPGVDPDVPSSLPDATDARPPQQQQGSVAPPTSDNGAVLRSVRGGAGEVMPARPASISEWVQVANLVCHEGGGDDGDDGDDNSETVSPVAINGGNDVSWEVEDMDMDSDWQKLQLASSATVPPLEWLAVATASATEAAATVTLEDATLDDWIPDAAVTSTERQNGTLILPSMNEGMAAWWKT